MFSLIFVADTKIICINNLVTPLSSSLIYCIDDSLTFLNWPECFNTRIVLSFDVICSVCYNTDITAFESVFTDYLDVAIVKLALVGLICNLGVQCTLDIFVFMSVTLRLNLFSRNDLCFATILSNVLVTFTYVKFILNIIQVNFFDRNLSIMPLAEKSNDTTSLINNDNKFIL